jgi:hypothetical protein
MIAPQGRAMAQERLTRGAQAPLLMGEGAGVLDDLMRNKTLGGLLNTGVPQTTAAGTGGLLSTGLLNPDEQYGGF